MTPNQKKGSHSISPTPGKMEGGFAFCFGRGLISLQPGFEAIEEDRGGIGQTVSLPDLTLKRI
jgi:hypothetical protein